MAERVFLGYYPKQIYVPDESWGSLKEICSVSNCDGTDGVSFDDGVPWHTCNRAHFYSTEQEAVAAAGAHEAEVFAYSLIPITFLADGEMSTISESFFPEGDALPKDGPADEYVPIGYDVIAYECYIRPNCLLWGCSPLSCNGYAGRFPVNQFCLIDDVDVAIEAAKV